MGGKMVKSKYLRVGPETLYFVRTSRIYHSIKYFANHSPRRLADPKQRTGDDPCGNYGGSRPHRNNRHGDVEFRFRNRDRQRAEGQIRNESRVDHSAYENRVSKRTRFNYRELYGFRAPDRSGRDDRHHGLVFGNVSRVLHVRSGYGFEHSGTHARGFAKLQDRGDYLTLKRRRSPIQDIACRGLYGNLGHCGRFGGSPRKRFEPFGLSPRLLGSDNLHRLFERQDRKTQTQPRVQATCELEEQEYQ